MKINCIHCGHAFGVDDSYCDYDGLLRCPTCGGLLDVAIRDGMVRGVRPGSLSAQPATDTANTPSPAAAQPSTPDVTPPPAAVDVPPTDDPAPDREAA